MGTLLGLVLAAGLLSVERVLQGRPVRRRWRRSDLLRRAGLPGATPARLPAAEVLAGGLAAAGGHALTGSAAGSVVAAVAGAALAAVLAGLALIRAGLPVRRRARLPDRLDPYLPPRAAAAPPPPRPGPAGGPPVALRPST